MKKISINEIILEKEIQKNKADEIVMTSTVEAEKAVYANKIKKIDLNEMVEYVETKPISKKKLPFKYMVRTFFKKLFTMVDGKKNDQRF